MPTTRQKRKFNIWWGSWISPLLLVPPKPQCVPEESTLGSGYQQRLCQRCNLGLSLGFWLFDVSLSLPSAFCLLPSSFLATFRLPTLYYILQTPPPRIFMSSYSSFSNSELKKRLPPTGGLNRQPSCCQSDALTHSSTESNPKRAWKFAVYKLQFLRTLSQSDIMHI